MVCGVHRKGFRLIVLAVSVNLAAAHYKFAAKLQGRAMNSRLHQCGYVPFRTPTITYIPPQTAPPIAGLLLPLRGGAHQLQA